MGLNGHKKFGGNAVHLFRFLNELLSAHLLSLESVLAKAEKMNFSEQSGRKTLSFRKQ